MEKLLEVVKFHLPRYENIVRICKSSPTQVNPSDLKFAMKFVAMYLSIHQSEGVTSDDLSIFDAGHDSAKEKGGTIYQKTLKTAGKYGFVSLILADAHMQVLNGYI